MTNNEELKQAFYSILKFAYENPNAHRNTMRKKLLNKGKISSKNKFQLVFDRLLSSGRINMENECVSINSKNVQLGILQKSGDEAYVTIPNSKKHIKVGKSVAAGYKSGDLLDVVIETANNTSFAFVLGKNHKEREEEKPEPVEESKDTFLKKENNILGRVVKLSHNELVFIPNKKSFSPRQIPILNNGEENASFQDKICIMNLVNVNAPVLGGYIIAVKGEAGNPVEEYDAIAESYGAIMDWTGTEIESEIEKIPTSVDTSNLSLITESQAPAWQRGRVVDLRHLNFTTVDPATCKDMDDAIYTTFNDNGDFVCYTAVANVTKYVKLNSEIGRRYVKSGFTIYAPNKAYNILPTKLSTGICSLNPHEDRLAFVIKTVVDKSTGKVKDSKIYDAIINSKQKYSYEEAQEIVDQTKDYCSKQNLMYKCLSGKALSLEEQVLLNYYAGQTIKLGFEQRKMIRFVSSKEREIVFDDGLETVVDIKAIPHLYYHEVIEAFMVTANEATAKYARDNNLENIFRVHDEPNPQKVNRANEFFELLGINFEGDLSAEGTRNLIELIKDTANEEVINKFLIKMQSRAVYSNQLYGNKKYYESQDWIGERISHYALQSPHYSHTTSPIRRVPDYVTQYNILAHIHGDTPIPARLVDKVVEIANDRQIEVDQAEKDFEDVSSVFYAEKHIGETMSGRVTKIRYTSPDEGYEDDIVVIVKNDEKGISAEIPLSQILGRPAYDCDLSSQRCAVYDGRGNIVLTLCKPIDFIIEKADRKSMIIVGRTSRAMVKNAEQKANNDYRKVNHYSSQQPAYFHNKEKSNRAKRMEGKKDHKYNEREEENEN